MRLPKIGLVVFFFSHYNWCIALFSSAVIGQSDQLEIFTLSLVD